MSSKKHRKKLKRHHIIRKINDEIQGQMMKWNSIQYKIGEMNPELVDNKIILTAQIIRTTPIERLVIEGVILDYIEEPPKEEFVQFSLEQTEKIVNDYLYDNKCIVCKGELELEYCDECDVPYEIEQ